MRPTLKPVESLLRSQAAFFPAVLQQRRAAPGSQRSRQSLLHSNAAIPSQDALSLLVPSHSSPCRVQARSTSPPDLSTPPSAPPSSAVRADGTLFAAAPMRFFNTLAISAIGTNCRRPRETAHPSPPDVSSLGCAGPRHRAHPLRQNKAAAPPASLRPSASARARIDVE